MRSDDLAPLLVPPPQNGLSFRQGEVITFNSATGANSIDVGGTTLVDVPMLNSGEAVALKAGHIVALLTWKSSWWILGRVTLPGSDQFASASVLLESAGDWQTDFTLNTTQTARASVRTAVPPWATRVSVFAVSHGNADNTTAVDAMLNIMSRIDTQSGVWRIGGQQSQMVFAGQQAGQVSSAVNDTIDNPGTWVDMSTELWTQTGTWTGGRTAQITGTLFFQSTS